MHHTWTEVNKSEQREAISGGASKETAAPEVRPEPSLAHKAG
jgi:hypothetical protein